MRGLSGYEIPLPIFRCKKLVCALDNTYIMNMEKFTKEHREKMSVSAKIRCTPEWKKNLSEKHRTKINDVQLKYLYESGHTQLECADLMGITRKIVENAMKRIGIKSRVAKKRNQWGKNNHMWKDGEASYACFHKRIQRLKGNPKKCEQCETTDPDVQYDWASMTKNYSDPGDYKRLCRSCHWKLDQTHFNFPNNN